ncbi:MAG: hypothetical protein Q6373_019145 [Candidatus Sigynarchaeota archaeon]
MRLEEEFLVSADERTKIMLFCFVLFIALPRTFDPLRNGGPHNSTVTNMKCGGDTRIIPLLGINP